MKVRAEPSKLVKLEEKRPKTWKIKKYEMIRKKAHKRSNIKTEAQKLIILAKMRLLTGITTFLTLTMSISTSLVKQVTVPIFPPMSPMDFIGKLRLMSQVQQIARTPRTGSGKLHLIQEELAKFKRDPKTGQNVINLTNSLMAGDAPEKCVAQYYAAYVFVFNFLTSLTSIKISKKEASERLLSLIGGEQTFPRTTMLAEREPEYMQGTEYLSRCFSEGALQAFELNFENFWDGDSLNVQTSLSVLVQELLMKKSGAGNEESCFAPDQEDASRLLERFIHFEVSFTEIEKKIDRIQEIEELTREKFRMSWELEYVTFRENIRELKSFIFENLTKENLILESRARSSVNFLEGVNRTRLSMIQKTFEELKSSFDSRHGHAVFIRLVRQSEQLIFNFTQRITRVMETHNELLINGKQKLYGSYRRLLDEQAMRLNELFWKESEFGWRPKKEDECDDDYLKYLRETRVASSSALQGRLSKKGDWIISADFREFSGMISSFTSNKSTIEKEIIKIWETLRHELELIWEVKPKEIDDYFSCTDPIRDWLNKLYSEFVALEIKKDLVEQAISRKYPDLSKHPELQKNVHSYYVRVMEVVRSFKAEIDDQVWKVLRGSISESHGVMQQWDRVVFEMKEQWEDRSERVTRELLVKGFLMEDIQKAIRKHDFWLEEVEAQDAELRETEFVDFLKVFGKVEKVVRAGYVFVAKEINLLLWKLLAQFEESDEDFETFFTLLEKALDDYQVDFEYEILKGELADVDRKIGKEREEINERHIEFWVKVFQENEEFWEDFGSNLVVPEPDLFTSDKLVCVGGELQNKERKPVNLEQVYQEFISNEVDVSFVFKMLRRHLRSREVEVDPDDLRSALASRFVGFVENLREWKAGQYEGILDRYLQREMHFERFTLEYTNLVGKFQRLWVGTENEFKGEWLKINDSTQSVLRLTGLLDDQQKLWIKRFEEKDKSVEDLMGRLRIFQANVRELLLKLSMQINESLFKTLEEQLAKTIDWTNPEEVIEIIWQKSLEKMDKKFENLQNKFVEEMKSVFVHLEVEFKGLFTSIEDSFKKEFSDRLKDLEEALSKLEPETLVSIPPLEEVCIQSTEEYLRLPFDSFYEKILQNEIQVESLEAKIKSLGFGILGKPVTRLVRKTHGKWVEMTREFKVRMLEEILESVIQSDEQVNRMLKRWDGLVARSIENWQNHTKSQIEEHVTKAQTTELINKIQARTKDYIRSALEMDEQLKFFYFGSYFQSLELVEPRVFQRAWDISFSVNVEYLSAWGEFRTSLDSLSKPVPMQVLRKLAKKVISNMDFWINENADALDLEVFKTKLGSETASILKNAELIETDHEKLWDLLNTKFRLTGPEGSLEEFWDEEGNCDIFKVIHHSTISPD